MGAGRGGEAVHFEEVYKPTLWIKGEKWWEPKEGFWAGVKGIKQSLSDKINRTRFVVGCTAFCLGQLGGQLYPSSGCQLKQKTPWTVEWLRCVLLEMLPYRWIKKALLMCSPRSSYFCILLQCVLFIVTLISQTWIIWRIHSLFSKCSLECFAYSRHSVNTFLTTGGMPLFEWMMWHADRKSWNLRPRLGLERVLLFFLSNSSAGKCSLQAIMKVQENFQK